MTREELETTILMNREDDEATIYTADPVMLRKLEGKEAYRVVKEDIEGGKVVARTYKVDKRHIQLRAKQRTLSPEAKEKARRNIAKARSERFSLDSGRT